MLTQEEKLSKFTLAINEYAQEQHDRIMREAMGFEPMNPP